MKRQKSSLLLVFLHSFLAIGALFGGMFLIVDSHGELSGLPLSLLEGSLFNSYLIPGIILFSMLGIIPAITAIALVKGFHWNLVERLNLFKDKHWSWAFSLYIGFVLIIWIIIQVAIIKELFILHFIYIFLGLIIQIVTLLPITQRIYSK